MRLNLVDSCSNTVRPCGERCDGQDSAADPQWKLRGDRTGGPDGHFGDQTTHRLAKDLRQAIGIAGRCR
ncbi:hypothetical protein ACQ4WX_50730 [Streptomyces lasalocidi]